MRSDDKNQMNYLLAEMWSHFSSHLNFCPTINFILNEGFRIYSKSLFCMPQKITIILAEAEQICSRVSIILTAQ